MGKTTGIEWADSTWNAWMGCTKVSQGCKNCYMFREQERYGHDPSTLRRSKTTFEDPLKWKDPRRIFVCSWSDFFHEDVPSEWRLDALEVMWRADHHKYLILTKRPELISTQVSSQQLEEIEHCTWIGVSAEDQEAYDRRVPYLRDVPAQVKFVSAEPLLGPIDMTKLYDSRHVDWMIVGGESGTNARIMQVNWAFDIYAYCIENEIPYFFKQWGEWIPNRYIDDEEVRKLGMPLHEVPQRKIDNTTYLRLGRYHIKDVRQEGQFVITQFPQVEGE